MLASGYYWLKNQSKFFCMMSCTSVLVLTGCSSTNNATQTGPLLVGPGVQTALGSNKKTYTYHSDIFLDVVIPVFDPGLPKNARGEIDYDELNEQGIWPQLRRAEAKRFAIQTKKALEKTGSFGSISVVPSPNASGDVFVLGSVDYSDSEVVKITATILDSQGKMWGNKQFEHKVSQGFFRDAMNKEKNPYQPVFTRIADYVYQVLKGKSEAEKAQIKKTTLVRYAQSYSPETFNRYVETKLVKGRIGKPSYYQFDLVGLPDENDKMLKRIETLRTQDQLFVDRLQDQYDNFDAKTLDSYRSWQKETLPEVLAAHEAESSRIQNAILTGVFALGTVLLAKNSRSKEGNIATAAGAIGTAWSLKNTMDSSEELQVHKASLDEMGQNLDLNLGPSVMELNDKTVELTGTAAEQYEQWKAHLKQIYDLEATPDTAL